MTKSDDKREKVQIAVMANDIHYIKEKVKEVSGEMAARLAVFENGYVRRDELNRVTTEFYKTRDELWEAIDKIRNETLESVRRDTRSQWKWIYTMTGGITLLGFLIGAKLLNI